MVSYEISFLCGALSLCVGAATIITIELVHPGCIQRQREPRVNVLGCFMKNLMWLLADITHILSFLCVCISVSLMSGCCIVCLPAALYFLWFVKNILSLIDVRHPPWRVAHIIKRPRACDSYASKTREVYMEKIINCRVEQTHRQISVNCCVESKVRQRIMKNSCDPCSIVCAYDDHEKQHDIFNLNKFHERILAFKCLRQSSAIDWVFFLKVPKSNKNNFY